MRRGFTLIEIAIVLVIIGLIVGGLMVGQSMIRNMEMNAAVTEISRYTAAAKQFKTVYNYFPGDIPNATSYWGRDNVTCSTHGGVIATNGTCNGNGNSVINYAPGVTAPSEQFQFWKQLSLAGLVEGQFTGTMYSSYVPTGTVRTGINIPTSKLRNAGISVGTNNMWANYPFFNTLRMKFNNSFLLGKDMTSGMNGGGLLSALESYSLDSKLDDGNPITGTVAATFGSASVHTCTDAAAVTATSANYATENSGEDCALHFREAF